MTAAEDRPTTAAAGRDTGRYSLLPDAVLRAKVRTASDVLIMLVGGGAEVPDVSRRVPVETPAAASLRPRHGRGWGHAGVPRGQFGGQRERLLAFLDFHRQTLLWKASELDADGLRQRSTSSTMTLAGLFKHLRHRGGLVVPERVRRSAGTGVVRLGRLDGG